MTAFVTSYQIGYYTGNLLFLLLALSCLWIARRERVQSACLYALGLAVLTFPLANVGKELPVEYPRMRLMGVLIVVLLAASFVLSVAGLLRWRRRRSHYDRGRWQGIAALLISGLCLVLVVAGIVNGIRQDRERHTDLPPVRRTGGEAGYVLEDFNLSFGEMGEGWVAHDPSNFHPEAKLFLGRRRPDLYLMVLPEILGVNHQMTLSGYLEVVRTNVRSAGENLVLREPVPMTVAGVAGSRFSAKGRVQGMDFHYEFWCGMKNGLAFQVTAFGRPGDEETIRSSHRTFLSGLTMIDPDRVLSLTGEHIRGRIDFPGEGFSVNLSPEQGWVTAAPEPLYPFGAFRAEALHGGQMIVSRAELQGLEPNLDAVATALLAMQGVALADETVVSRRESTLGDGTRVLDLVLMYESNPSVFRDYYRIYCRGDQLVLVNAWNEISEADANWDPSMTLDSVEIHEHLPELAYSAFSDARRKEQAKFVNQIGLYHFRRDQYEAALALFTRASAITPADPVLSRNRIEALLNMEEYDQVLSESGEHLVRFPDDFGNWGNRAVAMTALGRNGDALKIYEHIFNQGCDDDDILLDYINLLIDIDQPVGALLVIEREAKKRPSRTLDLWEGQVARIAREFRQSEAAFRRIAEAEGWNSRLYREMVETFLEEENYDAAWDWLDRQEAQMGATHEVWLGRGQVQLGLKNFLEAHVSFSQALERKPGDPEAAALLEELKRRLSDQGISPPDGGEPASVIK